MACKQSLYRPEALNEALRILHLEDNKLDRELVREALRAENESIQIDYAQTREAYLDAIENAEYNVIISDYALPNFSGVEALQIANQNAPETPFIYVSGTIGEERAVESLRNGATDYVNKTNMERLIPSIKRALWEVQEHQRRLQAEFAVMELATLVDKASDAIFVLDTGGRVVYWNKTAVQIYNRGVDAVVGQCLKEVIPIAPEKFDEAFRLTLTQGTFVDEFLHLDDEGKERIVEGRWTMAKTGKLLEESILCIHTDITEKKKLESQFLRLQRLEGIGSLTSGIAHDMNNILTPILLSVETLRVNGTPGDNSEIIDTIRKCALQGKDLLKQILSFGRGSEEDRVPIQLHSLLEDTRKIIAKSLNSSIRLETHLEPTLTTFVGDPTQLHQVFLNLYVNARDAMPSGGTITVRAQNVASEDSRVRMNCKGMPRPHVLIQVQDSGTGISKEIIDSVFDPFFTTKEVGKGTGLGLSTVNSIVKSHGGFVQVESKVDHGTTFYLYFPTEVGLSGQTDATTLVPVERGHGELIMVIDDEAPLLKATCRVLEDCGYRTLPYSNGRDAVTQFDSRKKDIALVITDLEMPSMNGVQTIQALRIIKSTIQVIAVSGTSAGNWTHELRKLGVSCFLRKPFSKSELANSIASVIRPKVS